MTNIVALTERDERTDAASAWRAIEAAQLYVKKTRDEINAAEKWIAIGNRFNELRSELIRSHRYDQSAPGFKQAFADHKRFGMNVKTGTKFAVIGQVFGQESMCSTVEHMKKLPANWVALYYLASGFKNHLNKLTFAIDNGEVSPLMTGPEAKALVAKHTPKKKSNKKSDKIDPKKADKNDPKPDKKITPMQKLDAARKDYITKAKLLTAAEREAEVAKLTKSLGIKLVPKPSAKPSNNISTLIDALAAAVTAAGLKTVDSNVKRMTENHAKRIEIISDVIDRVGADHTKLIKAYEDRLRKRGDQGPMPIRGVTKK